MREMRHKFEWALWVICILKSSVEVDISKKNSINSAHGKNTVIIRIHIENEIANSIRWHLLEFGPCLSSNAGNNIYEGNIYVVQRLSSMLRLVWKMSVCYKVKGRRCECVCVCAARKIWFKSHQSSANHFSLTQQKTGYIFSPIVFNILCLQPCSSYCALFF